MSYDSQIPNPANLVTHAVSGDLILMQQNFEHLVAAASGLVVSGTGATAALRGWLFGDTAKRFRYRIASDTSVDRIWRLSRNIGSDASPNWQNVLSITSGTGEAIEAAYPVAGQAPTASNHLTTRAYVDARTLSGLADTAVSGAVSGEFLQWNGSSWVPGTAVSSIADATDTAISGPTSGQVLTWNGAQWENADATGGSPSLSGLTDTAVSGAVSGQVLEFDGTFWRNKAFSGGTLSGLTDTTISSPSSGQVLGWNGSSWVNTAGAAGTLSGLTDTTITAPVSGAALRWNGSAWIDDVPTASGVGLVEAFDVAVESLASGDSFTLSLNAVYAYDVQTLYAKTTSGTCELTFKIDGTVITGLSGVLVNTSKATTNASAANSVAPGNALTFEVTSGGATVSGLYLTLKTERT